MTPDAAAKLQAIQEYAAYYKSSVAKAHGHNVVTHAEMSVILDDLVDLFKATGLGLRKNAVGQAMPDKRGWERHG